MEPEGEIGDFMSFPVGDRPCSRPPCYDGGPE